MSDELDLVDRIQTARAEVENRRQQKIRAEARHGEFLRQLNDFKQQLRDEGVEPAEIPELINKLRKELDDKLDKIEKELSGQAEPKPG